MKSPSAIINVADSFFPDHPGGIARLAYELALQQRQWGYRVFFICIRESAGQPEREDREGITVLRGPASRHPSPHPWNLWGKMIGAYRAVNKIAAEFPPVAVIHSHTPLPGIGALSAAARTFTRKIHSIHSPWLMEMRAGKNWESRGRWTESLKSRAAFLAASRLERKCFSLAEVLTCDSQFTRQEILKDYGRTLGSKPLQVYPGWVNTERFTIEGPRTNWEPELARPARGPVFFTVRSLLPRNGLELLLEAAALVKARRQNFELLIAGDGDLREALPEKIQALSLQDRVTLLGRVAEDRLPVLYRSCDAFVLPTLALECFGIIILEALASGKPVIATPVGAIPELLQPIFPEGLLPEISAPALAQAISQYLKRPPQEWLSPARRQALRGYVTQHFSLAAGTRRFREIYQTGSQNHPESFPR